MITDDQVAEFFAEANPISTLTASEADAVVDTASEDTRPERSRRMVTVQTEPREDTKRRRPLAVAALGVALAAVIVLAVLPTGSDQPEVAAPALGAELEALQTTEDFFAALTAGDVDGALALMAPELKEPVFNRPAVEFFAALPGSKTLSDCTTSTGPTSIGVSCTINYNGPLMLAVGEPSTGRFTVEDGLLTTFNPSSRDAAAAAFAEYASQTRPESYEQACSPESYPVASVRTQDSGFVFTGPCGELWAQVAEDAAAWVEAGQPPLTEEREPAKGFSSGGRTKLPPGDSGRRRPGPVREGRG